MTITGKAITGIVVTATVGAAVAGTIYRITARDDATALTTAAPATARLETDAGMLGSAPGGPTVARDAHDHDEPPSPAAEDLNRRPEPQRDPIVAREATPSSPGAGPPAVPGLDFSTPEATVNSFVRSAGSGSWQDVLTCFLPGGTDYEDTRQIGEATEADGGKYSMKQVLEAWDPAKPVEQLTTEALPDGRLAATWLVTMQHDVAIDGMTFLAGQKYEFDASLVRTDDGRWLIDGF